MYRAVYLHTKFLFDS